MAFLEPVKIATHLNKEELLFSGTRYLTEVFELIFVRSFEIPENACIIMTNGMEIDAGHPGFKNDKPARARG